jgi:HEAT repeat protein
MQISRAARTTVALGAAIFAWTAAPVYAQTVSQHPAVQRYNRIAKGSDVKEWKRRLSDEDAETRLEAVTNLGEKGGEDGVKPLIEALADSDPRIRIRAIDGLGNIGHPDASAPLMQLLYLQEIDKPTKLRVLTSLSRIADPNQAMLTYAERVEDLDLRCRAVYALGEIGQGETVDGIRQIESRHTDPELDRLCADAVRKIQVKEAEPENQQPTIIELERMLAEQQERARKAAER